MAEYLTSYIIPGSHIGESEKVSMRRWVESELLNYAKQIFGLQPAGAVVRSGRPLYDFGLAAEDWVIPALVVNTPLAYVNLALANNRVACFYKCWNRDPNPSIYRLRFMQGAAGAARGDYQLQELYGMLEAEGYFSEPVFFFPQEIVYVEVTGDATRANEDFGFGVLVCEPQGQVNVTPTVGG